MKRGIFVEGLSNQQRLAHAMRTVANRGAPEAGWLLAESDPGFGKSRTLLRLASLQRETTVFLRAKVNWTPNWMLTELAQELEVAAPRRTADIFRNIMAEIMRRDSLTIIVDEFQLTAHKLNVIEQLRDITDTAECMMIAGGNKGCFSTLSRYTQIRSRISELVAFGPATLEDIRKVVDQLCDVKLADDMLAHVHRETGGRLRDILNGLARVDAAMKAHRGPVTVEAWGNRPLLPTNRPQLAVVNG